MIRVEPEVFLVGETQMVTQGMQEFLQEIKVPDWETDAPSDSEEVIEIMSRLCYGSFDPSLNPNLTAVRDGNQPYLGNVVSKRHGSVAEHSVLNFIFLNVSRVFTHELVRHRVGTAMSQESGRYVRIGNLKLWVPTVIQDNAEALDIFTSTFEHLEQLQLRLAEIFELDEPGTSFKTKKTVTSAIRRIAPIGMGTVIGWSANFRTLRWVLETRTDPAAEEEIRLVFGKVGEIVTERYPNIFGDFSCGTVDGLPHYKPATSKV
jgi:thymidylate synthase (FAD)